ncbi:MAG: molybdopterin-dependent oxidoreductase, partial [Ktedonobacteraceae bacterium]
LIEQDWVDHAFIDEHTTGWDEVAASLAQQDWETLERSGGQTRADIHRFAEMIHAARTGILVWSMGLTQHTFGVANIKAVVNLALSQGWLGKEHCGVVPIRGHSGVQGGAEVGAVPNFFPGDVAVNPENSQVFQKHWGFEVPSTPGLRAVDMLDAAYDGKVDLLYCSGGNFLEVLPDPQYVRETLEKVPMRVHQDIYVTTQMLLDPAGTVVLLPAQTRYEQKGGGTETSTERRIIFSPEIPGPRIGEARCEWEIFQDLAARAYPEEQKKILFPDAQAIRDEIARVSPTYQGIEHLRKAGDQVQYGGRVLYRDGQFKTPDGKGHFSAITPPELELAPGKFILATRRGKQFNSLVHAEKDTMTGSGRDSLLISAEDAAALHVSEGARVRVKSDNGESMECRIHIDRVKPRSVQAYWPECNVLIRRRVCDVQAGVPDYNAIVEIEPISVKAFALTGSGS